MIQKYIVIEDNRNTTEYNHCLQISGGDARRFIKTLLFSTSLFVTPCFLSVIEAEAVIEQVVRRCRTETRKLGKDSDHVRRHHVSVHTVNLFLNLDTVSGISGVMESQHDCAGAPVSYKWS